MKFQLLGYEIVIKKQIETEKVSKKRPYKKWTDKNTGQLKDLLEKGFTISDISTMMNRPYSTVQKKIKRIIDETD